MYEITCEDHPAQRLLTLTQSLPREAVGEFLGGAYPALFGAVQAAGAAPTGPPIARYRMDEEAFHITAGVPFRGEVAPQPPMAVEDQPALTVATTVHTGAYDGLPEAFHAVMEWITANGYVIVADPWECYLDGPEVAQPRTKVCFPVVAA